MSIQISQTVKKSKRVGRGAGSGKGKTSGRGMNGQKSRTGSGTTFFEGGQTKLINRLPKARGFKSRSKKTVTVTAEFIAKHFKEGENVSADQIIKKLGLSKNQVAPGSKIKIINSGQDIKNIKLSEDLCLSKSLK